MGFRDALKDRVLFLDGALGTEFYARGVFINRSYESLNVGQPAMVQAVHEDYAAAGCDMITTNTFGGNRLRLAAFGLADQLEAINREGVRIARRVAADRLFVAGSIGPTGQPLSPVGMLSPGDAYAVFREQAALLIDEGVDLVLLETFEDLGELWQAVRAVRDVSPTVPIVASMSFVYDLEGVQVRGPDPEHAARTMSGWSVECIGANCSNGPKVVLDVLDRMSKATDLPLVAFANAGQPQVVDGRKMYMASPEYMAEFARRFVHKGARIVGGCCGTTPAMMREMRSFVRSVVPVRDIKPLAPAQGEAPERLEPVPIPERSAFARKLSEGRFCVSVELDPPRGLDPSKSLEGAAFLRAAGVDIINIADGPRAIARMGPAAMAQLARERCGIDSVIHYCCRDRNLLGMQMDLIGAHALGLHNILAVTGDPPKMGNYPNATAVFDIDSIGLLHFIQSMNRGLDFSGRPMRGQTSFFVGAGCNPAHTELDREIVRFGKKIEAGAEFFFSQPVYDPEILERFLDATEQFPTVPFLVGILPLASYKNAEFLHNEVPGMQVPQAIRDRLKAAPDRQAQRDIGIDVARETLIRCRAHPRVSGVYIYPPFGSYKAVLRVLEGIVELEPRSEAPQPA